MSGESLVNLDKPEGRFYLYLLLLTLVGLCARVFLLAGQPVSEDDFSVALTAVNYVESGQFGPTMWNHPELRNLLVYYAMRIFGPGLVGVKGWSLLFGILCTPLVGLVSRRILKSDRAALLATFFWAVDLLAIDFSRQGINDIYLAFFPLLGILCAYRFRDAGRMRWLVLSALAFGLGLASKWSALFPLAVTTLLLQYAVWREPRPWGGEKLLRLATVSCVMLLVPFLVYLLTFLPFFERGYSLAEWGELQRSMYKETSQHTGYKPKPWDDRDHHAIKWFLVPGATFVDSFTNMDVGGVDLPLKEWSVDKNVTVILGVANPLVWLLVLPGVFLAAWRGVKKRDEGLCYLAALFFLSYLPLAATTRPIWVNTTLSVLPYALTAAAYLVHSLTERLPRRRLILGGYLGAVAACALVLYPLAIGKGLQTPIARDYVKRTVLDSMKNPESRPAPAAR